MKKILSFKRIIIFLSISVPLLLGLYILWGIYQAENISVVPVNDINNVSLSADDTLSIETEISGEATVDDFEEITHINKETVDDVLYVIVHKQPSFTSENKFLFNLNNVRDLDSVNEISIVSGNIYTGEGAEQGYSIGDLKNLPEQKTIWTRTTN